MLGKSEAASIRPKDSMVGTGGIEPPTPSVSGKCSPAELRASEYGLANRLSKRPLRVNDFLTSGNHLAIHSRNVSEG